jgi:hypothetical protein
MRFVRLAVIGPSGGDVSLFARMAELLLNTVRVDRAVYLGADDALNETVTLWAQALVGPDASDDRLWERALEVARTKDVESIDALVRSERARLRLKSIEGLPPQGLRVVEMFGHRLAPRRGRHLLGLPSHLRKERGAARQTDRLAMVSGAGAHR